MTTLVRPTMTPAEIQQLAQQNRERVAAQRLDARAPASGSSGGSTLVSTIRLKVTDVAVYERNPRHATHERIMELKESIRINGIEQIVTVTRRPKEERYVVAKGGNTRLLAAQALYEETCSAGFLYRDFLFVEYPGEARLLAAHLRENDQRSDLCFWDKANGYLALKGDLESELGRTLSLREFSKMLADDGTQISHALLGLFRFAFERLGGLGEATACLSGRDVSSRIQPKIGAILRLVQKLGHGEHWLQQQVLDPELELARVDFEQSRVIDVDRLIDAIHLRCAGLLGTSRAGLDAMLRLLDKLPDASADVLRAAAILPQPVNTRRAADAGRYATESGHVQGDPAGDRKAGDVPEGMNEGKGCDDEGQFNADRDTASAAHVELFGLAACTPMMATPQEPVSGPSAQTRLRSAGMVPPFKAPASIVDPSAEAGSCPARGRLWQALARFANASGLDGCLRETGSLPYGFMVEPPALAPGEPALDRQAAGSGAGRHRYHGWWWLVSLSQQNSPAGAAVVPSGAFSGMVATDDTWQEACDTWVGEQLLSDRFYLMFFAILDPGNEAGGLLLDLMAAARAFRESHPERFEPQFWLAQGVDERLVQVG